MSHRDGHSRREWLRLAAMGGVLLSAPRAAAQAVRRTPSQVLGPFYPVAKPSDQDADLTAIAGRPGRPAGRVIEVSGRVVNQRGEPVAGARIEIWQANSTAATPTPVTAIRRRSIPTSRGTRC